MFLSFCCRLIKFLKDRHICPPVCAIMVMGDWKETNLQPEHTHTHTHTHTGCQHVELIVIPVVWFEVMRQGGWSNMLIYAVILQVGC